MFKRFVCFIGIRGIGGTRDSTPTVFFLFVLLALGAFLCISWMALYIRVIFDEFDLRSFSIPFCIP